MPVTNAQQPTHADALAVVVEEAVVAVLAEGAPQPAVLDARDVTLATASLKMGRAATEELDVTARMATTASQEVAAAETEERADQTRLSQRTLSRSPRPLPRRLQGLFQPPMAKTMLTAEHRSQLLVLVELMT